MLSKHLKHSGCFFVLMVYILSTAACSSPPLTKTVDVTEGTIEGVEQDGIFSYKGIPFLRSEVYWSETGVSIDFSCPFEVQPGNLFALSLLTC